MNENQSGPMYWMAMTKRMTLGRVGSYDLTMKDDQEGFGGTGIYVLTMTIYNRVLRLPR